MSTYHHRCKDGTTWCNRDGTYIRVLIVTDPDDPPFHVDYEIDITVQRLVVLTTANVGQLNEHTSRLQAAAELQGIRLVSADGYHRIFIDRIAAANNTSAGQSKVQR